MKIAIISDIHSNLEALQAVLKDIENKKIKKAYCVGDIVGYNANPNECIELIRKNKISSVQGNHDLCCVNLKRIGWFNIYGQEAALWTNKKLTLKNKNFLLKLPQTIEQQNLFLVHGSPEDPLYEYIFPDVSSWRLRNFFNIINKKTLIMGHTHVPFIKKYNKKLVINPGSVGQPRDGDNRASYCILDTKKFNTKIIKVQYNITKAAQKVIKAKLPSFLALRLHMGI